MKYRHKFDHKKLITSTQYNKLPEGSTKDLYEPAEEAAPVVTGTDENGDFQVETPKKKKKSTAKKETQ